MGFFSKEIYERKTEWAARRMKSNSRIKSLSKEQHDTLSWLCSLRHDVHSSWEDMWNSETADGVRLWEEYEKINDKLCECGLSAIMSLPDISEIPTNADYWCVLTDEDRDRWDLRADVVNKQIEIEELERGSQYKPLHHSGSTIWREESGEYGVFADKMESINTAIENYLEEIDRKHGTSYCPSGYTRL